MTPEQTTQAFKVQVSREAGSEVVTIHGALVDEAHLEAKEAFLGVLLGSPARILVDLTDVSYISSYGIGLLVAMLRRCRQRGIRMPVCGLRPEVQDLFQATRLSQVFEVFHDRASALSAR